MSGKKLLSVLIPGRNQGDILGKTIDDIAKHGEKLTDFDIEVVYIDGNSKDESKKVAESNKDKFKNLIVLSDPPDARGKGGALKLGMEKASGDFKMFMDADNSTNFSEIDKLLPYIDKYDIVLGSRYSTSVSEPEQNWFKAFGMATKDVIDVLIYGHAKRYTAKVKQGRWREFVSRGGNLAFTVLLGQAFADSRCGFKLWKAEAADTVFSKLTSPGFGFDTEALVLAKKFKYKITQVPVEWFDEAGESNIGIKAILGSFVEIFKIRLNLIIGKYKK
jgi:dolichyl-phosphate beta-glucosyltransferase